MLEEKVLRSGIAQSFLKQMLRTSISLFDPIWLEMMKIMTKVVKNMKKHWLQEGKIMLRLKYKRFFVLQKIFHQIMSQVINKFLKINQINPLLLKKACFQIKENNQVKNKLRKNQVNMPNSQIAIMQLK